jgi:hypothetical protein
MLNSRFQSLELQHYVTSQMTRILDDTAVKTCNLTGITLFNQFLVVMKPQGTPHKNPKYGPFIGVFN